MRSSLHRRSGATFGLSVVASVLALGASGCPSTSPPDAGGLDAAPEDDADVPRLDAPVDAVVLDVPSDVAPRDTAEDDVRETPDACPAPTLLCGDVCADLRADPDHCGDCESRCIPLAGSIPFCSNGHCVNAVCRPGFGNCDGDRSNGCEVGVDSDVAHCGRCDRACEAAPNATPSCVRGGCTLTCEPGWRDCDPGTPGCECPS